MWILSILLGLAFTGGLMADAEHELQACLDELDLENFLERIEQSESHLDTACPVVLNFMDCVDDAVEKATGFRMAFLANMAPNTDVSRAASAFVNLRSVTGELCTDGTELNQAYKENAECLEGMDVDPEECRNIAHSTYDSYKQFEDTVQEEAGEDTKKDNRQCMTQAYQSACIAVKVHEKCGQSAFEVYQTLVKRSTVFSNALCSKEDLETLKTKFLDSMELENEEKDLFRLAFDLRKRRK